MMASAFITARVAEGVARANPCTLVLIGRSPLPEGDEDPRTAGALDRSALRRALLDRTTLRDEAVQHEHIGRARLVRAGAGA